jgi:hypothetical protein
MSTDDGANRRTDERLGLQLPVRVQGFHADGKKWEEMTTGEDISAGGAAFPLKHEVAKGQALILTLPLPRRYRTFDLSGPTYRVFALVRKVENVKDEFRVGAMFIGKTAPRGFDENPTTRYLLPGERKPPPATNERRVEPRYELFLNLRMKRGEDAMGGALEEVTVADNLSRNGARVRTSLPIAKGEVLYLEELGGTWKTRAEVMNVTIGKDHIPRLGLKFLDEKAPGRLLAS